VASRAITNNQQSAWSSDGNVTLNGTANLAPNQTASSGSSVMTRSLVDAHLFADGEPVGWQYIDPSLGYGGGNIMTKGEASFAPFYRGTTMNLTSGSKYGFYKIPRFTSTRTNLLVVTTWLLPPNNSNRTWRATVSMRDEVSGNTVRDTREYTNTIPVSTYSVVALTNLFNAQTPPTGDEMLIAGATTNATYTITNTYYLTEIKVLLY